MQRLYADKLYSLDGIVDIDKDRLVRIDDREQRVDVQEKVSELLAEITPETFCSVGDYDGYKADFLKLNGFGLDGVDYDEDIDLAQFGVV
nr:hypothetical protein [uncultured Cohaesibacter sp.]